MRRTSGAPSGQRARAPPLMRRLADRLRGLVPPGYRAGWMFPAIAVFVAVAAVIAYKAALPVAGVAMAAAVPPSGHREPASDVPSANARIFTAPASDGNAGRQRVLVLADPRDAPDTRKPLRGWGKATVPVADVPGANWRPSVIVTLGPDQFGPVFGVAAERARQADLVRVVGIAGYAWTARDTGRGEGVLFYLRDDHTLIKDRKGRRVRTVYTDLAVLAAIAGSSDRAGVARLGELLLDPEKVEATGSPVSPELAADLSEGLRVAEGPRLIDEERALALALSLPGIYMDASMISAARRALVSITEPTPDSEASSGLEPRRHIGLGTDLGDGRVLTAAHVVEGNVDPRVDGYPVEIVRVDEANDLALLRVRGRRGGVPVRLAETPPAPGTFTAIFDAARTDHRGRPTSWTTVFGPVDPTQGHRNMPAGALTLDQPSWPGFSGGLVVTASVDGALSIGVLTGGGQAQYGGYPSPYAGELEWGRGLTFITPAT
ncbi:MAG: trypsin-like peptidase domain-containing protein, partial [Pseudonocardia sp.]|nr:trypsin-like peptidase domain-containing protein [Pseudonocardia sp.]